MEVSTIVLKEKPREIYLGVPFKPPVIVLEDKSGMELPWQKSMLGEVQYYILGSEFNFKSKEKYTIQKDYDTILVCPDLIVEMDPKREKIDTRDNINITIQFNYGSASTIEWIKIKPGKKIFKLLNTISR